MTEHPLFPLQEEAERLTRHCRLPVHAGTARLHLQRGPNLNSDDPMAKLVEHFKKQSPPQPPLSETEYHASFLLPASGNCFIFLRQPSDVRLSRDFAQDLTMTGTSPDGPFRLHCPEIYVQATGGGRQEPGWAIAQPVNHPAILTYGDSRPVARVCAVINNFDFRHGNVAIDGDNSPGKRVLRVQAEGRTVDFARRGDYQQVKTLLTIGALHCGALVEFSFAAWESASEEDLATFAYHVAGLCCIVAQQQTRIPVLSFLDEAGRPIKRLLGNALESRFRDSYIIRFLHFENGLPRLFERCFGEYVKLVQSDLWGRLPAFCATIQDGDYLEQRCATLMAAVELLLRSSLIEAGHCSPKTAERMDLSDLIGAAKTKLGWSIPKHYTVKDRHRRLRNAVAHGGPLPEAPIRTARDVQKWSLFLMRRFLIRLGFDSEVASPSKGYAASSPVDVFSEECNSFEPS